MGAGRGVRETSHMSIEEFNVWFKEVREVADLIEGAIGRRVTRNQGKGKKYSLFAPEHFCWFTFQKTKPKPFRWVVKAEWVESKLLEQRPPEYRGKYKGNQPTVGWYTESTDLDRRQIAKILARVCESRHR